MKFHPQNQLFTLECGPADASTLVFLHGGGGAGWMWKPQLAHFTNYHCLVPDLPEHGQSAAIGPLTVPFAAEKVAELISAKAHGGKAYVVGLSLGAQVLVSLLSQAPERVEKAVISSA